MKFKAAVLTRINEPLEVLEAENLPLTHGQVFVRVTKSGLCGAQLQEIRGEKGNSKFLPHLLGHEGCGIVEEIGSGVTKVKEGDKVVMHWRKGRGSESDFPKYALNGKEISGGKVTTLSEYSTTSENRLTPVPNNIPDDFCALLGCGLSTSLSVVNKEANVKFGDKVLVIGCGGVGLGCVLFAKMSHAQVIGLDTQESKRKLVEDSGATFFNLKNLKQLLDENMSIDCIIDTSGYLSTISQCLPNLSEDGRVILVAQPKQGDSLSIINPMKFFNTKGITIKTTQAGGFDPDIDIPKYTRMFLDGNIEIEKIITNYFPLTEINQAVEKLKSGTSGRIMINI